MKVLLADDNPINREIAAYFLEELNCEVCLAVDGVQAVDAYAKNVFDLILMDIEMPNQNGIEATAKIREKETDTGKHTPIIALTAYTMDHEVRRFKEAGMDGHISKPLSIEKLREVLAICSSKKTQEKV